MSEVNWGAIQQFDNPGERFATAFKEGQQTRQQNIAKAAYAALVRDPSNTKALEALASVNPQAAMQFQQQAREQAMAGLEQHREKITQGAMIVRQIQPKDQNGWNLVLQTAQQAGIDLTDVPHEFNPQYVQGLVAIADAFKPQAEQRGRIITPQPGAGAWELQPDGTMKELIRPNDGSQRMGAPVGSGPQPGTVEDGYRFKGGNPADPNSWEPVSGGPTARPSGGFPGN